MSPSSTFHCAALTIRTRSDQLAGWCRSLYPVRSVCREHTRLLLTPSAVIPGGQPSAPALQTLADNTQDQTYVWTVSLAAGTSVTLRLTDANGDIKYSAPVTIQAGSSTDCLNASATSAAGAAGVTSGGASASVSSAAGSSMTSMSMSSSAAGVGASVSSASSAVASRVSSASGAVSSASGAVGSSASSARSMTGYV